MLSASATMTTPELMPTPRATIARLGGTARLYRFGSAAHRGSRADARTPLLIVPSMINRWYVVDLRAGASLVGALREGGVDTFCLDWGVANDEDRYLEWEEVIRRVARAIRAIRRETGAEKVALLGYCMGSIVSAIQAALAPQEVAAFINLAGPIDFSKAGVLRELVDARWFDADAVASAGNVEPGQMQAGFVALRPTLEIAKWVRVADKAGERRSMTAFRALEAWASDGVPFPGAAYRTYITELYQQNRLVRGTHEVGGRLVELANIDCPVLTICATRDAICPADSATALGPATSSSDASVLTIEGGHVGAVVGSRAVRDMYPAVLDWLSTRLQPILN